MKKILINLNAIKKPLTGIAYYTINIVKELLAREGNSLSIKVIIGTEVYSSEYARKYLSDVFNNDGGKGNRIIKNFIPYLQKVPYIYDFKYYIYNERLKNKLNLLASEDFVYFEPSFVPFSYRGEVLTTIHDLSFLSNPEFHPKNRVKYLTKKIPYTLANSDHIFVDSYFIQNEIKKYYPDTSCNISVLYLGVDADFFNNSCSKVNLNHLGIKNGDFLLSVATLEPRKNFSRLIDAFLALPEEIRNQHQLVLVGSSGWKNSEIYLKAKQYIDNGQIVITGYISDDELKLLYRNCKLFIYPSVYEGFGLPIIEAMAAGCIVATSNLGATAEVAGSSAIFFDPYDINSIKNSILDFINSNEKKIHLTDSSIIHATKFSWERTVDELLNRIKN